MAREAVAPITPSTALPLPASWHWRRLDSVCDGIFDCPHSTPALTEDGPYIARSQDIRTGVFRSDEAGRVSDETYQERISRATPGSGDLLYSREGTYFGIAAEVPSGVPVCLGQRMVLLRPNPSIADSRFLRYWLNSPVMASHVHGYRDGTVAERLNLPTIRGLPVALPPLAEQHAIARILGTLDDKIELNRRMSDTLEGIARALFKSWFVDFDPVRAKAEGRNPGLPKPLAELFPARLVDSEFGEVPKGWRVGILGDVAEHRRRSVQPAQIWAETPYIALEHMPKRCIALSDWGVAEGLESSKFEFRKGEILFGKLRPYFHKVGIAPIDGVCSTDIVVVVPQAPCWFTFVLALVSRDEFVGYTNVGSTGTKMPRTSWADMARYELVLPPESVASAFTRLVTPSVVRIIAGIHESRALSALRDTLLPKLIAGVLQVKSATGCAEEVTA